ncbi:hypothetical protein C2G38_2158703 [Gigaspora rosea]|uniref:Uncharacterized protein n=1 Tax=Gigaspora rosea TaxID=44941 RepID=A0A397W9H5_9GLOM|nr:hypothetical protein C2G38_2158703 [Gigaspora rosea]
MHGAIGQAKDAILQIIECLIHGEILSESDITCFIYNSECNAVNFSENPNMLLANGEIKKFFDTINAGGARLIMIWLSSSSTDGVDDSTLNEELKNNLKGALSNIPYELRSSFMVNTKKRSLCQNWRRTKIKYFGDNGIGTFIINCEKKDQKIVISKDQKSLPETAHEFTTLHIMSDSDPMAIQLIIQFIQEKIIILMNKILICDAGAGHEKCQQTLAVVDFYDKRLDEISNYKSNDFENTKNLIDIFKDFLTKEEFSNDKIAEFNDFAYGIAASMKLKSSVDICESKNIFIPYEDGIWNGQEIYNSNWLQSLQWTPFSPLAVF